MYQIDFKKPIHVHFIGIGGISMSGLAEILLAAHFTVSGSDSKESPLTDLLTSRGAEISYGQRADNIKEGTDLVVYTAAIHPDNPEYQAAVSKGIPMMTRAELLGQLMTNYKTSIAVSGTHGKTSTTSMASHILLAAQKDPTISVGGILKAIHGNIRVGSHDTFITEDGGGLSQGQKQLLCIARVMLALPPMLILDEATSSIDTRTEIRIQKAFNKMMKGRTTFIVAHRLSTIKEADIILVMNNGKIIEQGNHQQLLEQKGFYYNLYNSQYQ